MPRIGVGHCVFKLTAKFWVGPFHGRQLIGTSVNPPAVVVIKKTKFHRVIIIYHCFLILWQNVILTRGSFILSGKKRYPRYSLYVRVKMSLELFQNTWSLFNFFQKRCCATSPWEFAKSFKGGPFQLSRFRAKNIISKSSANQRVLLNETVLLNLILSLI